LTAALIAAALATIGCKTLSYEGMPAKNEPHAMALEDGGIDFIAVDGRPVHRPAFSLQRLLLAPGPHEVLARFDDTRHDTDYAGDLQIDITVHYWSRYANAILFDAREGTRYYIGADGNLPSTGISYDVYERELPRDDAKDGRISISVEHELTKPEDWHPVITRVLPIKNYWKHHPLPVAAPAAAKPPAAEKAPTTN
jgi:hypothetical protein